MTDRLQAYTLLEILMVLVLSALVISIAYQGLDSLNKFTQAKHKQSDRMEAEQRLDYILFSECSLADSLRLDDQQLSIYHKEGSINQMRFLGSHVLFERKGLFDSIAVPCELIGIERLADERRQRLSIGYDKSGTYTEKVYHTRTNSLPLVWD